MSEDPRINLEPDWVCPIKQKQIFFFFLARPKFQRERLTVFVLNQKI